MAAKKHLTDQDRIIIEEMLRNRKSLRTIAQRLKKSQSTISREIRKRAIKSDKSAPHRIANRCIHRVCCIKRDLCGLSCRNEMHHQHCSCCHFCNSSCPEYVEEICPKLSHAPYVCNGCPDTYKCVLRKNYYLHQLAEQNYRKTLSESRSGANITEEELQSLNGFISPLIRKGQSLHHIILSNPDQLDCSEKTLYRYVDSQLLAARNYDMPRVIRMRPRKQKSVEHKIDKGCRMGRSWNDYSAFIQQHPDIHMVEMDSVIGNIGGKVLLTLSFPDCSFMLAFLRNRNSSQSVIDIFNNLYGMLGLSDFSKLFPVILTDNGSEFSNPSAIEWAPDGSRRTSLFYCNPFSPFQKPHVEVNHELIRRILPKSSSFDSLSQSDINLVMNHINSYKRKKLNNRAPFEVFSFLYGQDLLDRLGFIPISSNEISLVPDLLK